ncbi:translational activator for mitochondrial COX1 [Desmophyllum pertusum]|uniref:Translational activator for mitochondrial COX1 n=1 Tax=Desmophyllum pertusum TaxID=174260 RepID=A0A9W9YPH6_9CNID|nr:translational activator for mitochondrial COX1 [Desmophyllum pertusum]
MTKYDSQGVPVLSFHNPAGTILYPTGLYTYAMGNTRGRDLTELLGTSTEQHLDLLLLASGDVRNVLCTVSELSLRKPHERPKSLKFYLNDYDPTVVARNAVLLEVACAINPDITADMDFLWNIWYNLALSKAHFDRLRDILSELLERNFEGDESFLMFPDSAVLRECHAIWKDWIDLDLEVKSVQEERNRLIEDKGIKIDSQCLSLLTQTVMAINEFEELDILFPTPSNPFYKEIKHWYSEGSTSNESEKTNPTLIRPFVHKWKQHYNSCAFESYLPFERQDLTRCKSLTAACKENLTSMVKSFQQQKQNHSTTVQVTLWTGDALGLCTSGFPPDLLFDVIDTSNVSDHIGFAECSHLLRPKA